MQLLKIPSMLVVSSFMAISGSLALTGCGSSSGGGGGGSSAAPGISKLSPSQQQAFQAWLSAPVKSCDAIDVVGEKPSETPDFGDPFPGMPPRQPTPKMPEAEKGVDIAILAKRTRGSFWIPASGKNGSFAILSGSGTGLTQGVGSTKFESRVNVDGAEYSVKVETSRSGFDCTVKINDVEVAKVALAKTVEIAAASSSKVQFQPVTRPAKDFVSEVGGVTLFNTVEVQRRVESTMGDETTAWDQINGIGYSVDEAKKYFQLRRGSSLASAFGVEFQGSPTIAFATEFGETVVPTPFVSRLPVDGRAEILTFASVFRVTGGTLGGVVFSGPGKTHVMTVRRQINMTSSAGNITVADSGNPISLVESEPTAAEADQCVDSRLEPYATLYRVRLAKRESVSLPMRRTVFGPCEVYEPGLEARMNANGRTKKVLNAMLRGVSREMVKTSPVAFSYGDWNGFVQERVLAALDKSSTDTLADVPDAYLLTEIDGLISEVKRAPEYSKLSKTYVPVFADAIVATSESSRGTSIEAATLNRAVGAAVKVGDAYVDPFVRLLRARSASGAKGTDVGLAWIDSVSSSYLQVGAEAANEARALEYLEYLVQTHNQFFFVQPSEATLTNARDRMRSVRQSTDSYPQLNSLKGSVSSVLLGSKIDAAEFPPIINAAANMASANVAMASSYLDLVQKTPTSPEAVNARTWGLGLTAADQKAIQDYVVEASSVGAESDARSAVREMPMTRPTSTELQIRVEAYRQARWFLQSEATRAQGSTRDYAYKSRSEDLARRIGREMFTKADVDSLEFFARVSASDTFCNQDIKTISVRLNCVGLELFSKKSGKLLSDEYQGRYQVFAMKASGWMNLLVPELDHFKVRRELKDALFGKNSAGPWGACRTEQFDVNNLALDVAMGRYLSVPAGDISARLSAGRAVSAALEARCP